MPRQAYSDETLMAYADGELDVETARSLEAALSEDAELARRLSVFTGTRDALAELAAMRPPEPVPDGLMARIRATLDASAPADDNVTPLHVATRHTQTPATWWPAALAASLALALGLAGGYFAAEDRNAQPPRVAVLEAEGLPDALSRLPSGEETSLPAGALRMIASFRDDSGALCREFELDAAGGRTMIAVACRAEEDWDMRLAISTGSGSTTGYAPASSLDAVEAYLTGIGAGPALDPEQEAAALGDDGP